MKDLFLKLSWKFPGGKQKLLLTCLLMPPAICLGLSQSLLAQVDFTSSNLPIVVLNTHDMPIPYDDPRIVADMGIIYNGPGKNNHVNDAFNHYEGKISIEIRGSSSAGWAKKQYAIETQNDDGSNRNISLLGMPKENDWILSAPYYDRSMMRNVLAYRLARQLGWWAPRTRFCELVLNGSYQGVYVLMEKIKADKKRVNIKRMTPQDVSGDSVTGGYIIKIDKEDWKPGFTSYYRPFPGASQQIIYQYHEPKGDEIVQEQKDYIRDYINDFETVMAQDNFSDPVDGYAAYLDVPSFIDYFIVNELVKNVDAYRLSAYFYKKRDSRGGKLYAGPVWDFNFSLGNVAYYGAEQTDQWEVMQLYQLARSDYWLVPFWWPLLAADTGFQQHLYSRWIALRQGVLRWENIATYVNATADTLQDAVERNFQIWLKPGEEKAASDGWWPPDDPIQHLQSYQDEINYLLVWLYQRLQWMDETIHSFNAVANQAELHVPRTTSIQAIYPNPFNAATTVLFNSLSSQSLHISLWDVTGRHICDLFTGNVPAGRFAIHVDANHLSSGVYFVRAVSPNGFSESRKLVLLK